MLEDSQVPLTPLTQLGEFGLIQRISQNFGSKVLSTYLGIGDDAALIDINEDECLAVSTDMLAEGVHFDLSYTPLKHLGYKSVAVNVSDIYAMNARPDQITVSLALSSKYTVEAVDELYEGIKIACEYYGVDLVGGDTTTSRSGMVISITAIGRVNKNKIAQRNGANVNDLLCVSGDLGAAYLGLQILEREKKVYLEAPGTQPDLSSYDYLLGRQLRPDARKDVYEMLDKYNVIPTSMIDTSDGLASEVLHLSKASNIGIKVFEHKIPLDNQTILTADEFNMNPVTAALNGGEDYELLFTISQADYDKIKDERLISIIGHTMNTPLCQLIPSNGEPIEITAQGWNAFRE